MTVNYQNARSHIFAIVGIMAPSEREAADFRNYIANMEMGSMAPASILTKAIALLSGAVNFGHWPKVVTKVPGEQVMA